MIRRGRSLCFGLALFLLLCSPRLFSLDRSAFTFTQYDLRVRVTPSSHTFAAEGMVVLRNDSAVAQKNLSLQISSTLDWKSIRVDDKQVTYVTHPYETDIDHTGAVTEAIVELPSAIAPKQTLELRVSYGGTIPLDTTRLTRIGVPAKFAAQTDWGRISSAFTAIRGFGYVCWYPVAMDAVSLSQGNAYFDALGSWKERNAGSTMKVSIGTAGRGTVAANGRITGTRAHEALKPNQPSTRESDFEFSPIGLYPPSFAVANYSVLSKPAINISYLSGHDGWAEQFAGAAEKVLPLITRWFGPEREPIQVIELADAGASPFDSGRIVFMPLGNGDTSTQEVEVAHQLAHASEPAGLKRPWISEGWAQFAQALERDQQGGRQTALDWMSPYMSALQVAEQHGSSSNAPRGDQSDSAASKEKPDQPETGQPLVRATDPTYYSIKSMFVWWMLRDMVGDRDLQSAIHSYQPGQDHSPTYMQQLIEAKTKRDLTWFFDGWVYNDRGLPDFSVKTAFARTMSREITLVTVTVVNDGSVGAEVPVIVQTAGGDRTKRLLVDANSTTVTRIEVPEQPLTVTVNDGSVPESNMENNVFKFGAEK